MLALVAAHALAGVLAPLLVHRLGRWAFGVLALVPLSAVVWAVSHVATVTGGGQVTQRVDWVGSIGLGLHFRLAALQWLLVLVVAGIGVLVLVYCIWYFASDAVGLGFFAASLTAFMGAMLGLVLADDLLLIYVFWELTTIFSFLLIGFDPTSRAARLAAIQALLVTTLGGLAMLVGFLLLGREAGTFSVSGLISDPPSGPATIVAVLLVLSGAISKSAQVPFHFWLPGAMAAPTPVSAYLHAASMVKAGVFLVALLAPAFAGVPGWHGVLLGLGTLTMLVGGWRALRQVDVKLLLAHGTVSQLGFLMVVVSIGSRTAALAGLGLLLAHAAFKATLFLCVGIVDKLAGTRDLHVLSGVGRRLPAVAVAAALAGASMAGLPPLVGFVAKETMWTALLELVQPPGGERLTPGVPVWAGWLVLVGLLVGSCLTVAYTLRFWWGTFLRKPGVADTEVARLAPGFAVSPVLLAAASLGLGFVGAALTAAIRPYADRLPDGGLREFWVLVFGGTVPTRAQIDRAAEGHQEYLALWHGWELPLLLSAVTVVVGIGLFWATDAVCRLQARTALPFSAERVYRATLRLVDRVAIEVTGTVQRGSVTAYLAIILLVVLIGPGGAAVAALVRDGGDLQVVAWDRVGQPLVAVVMIAAGVATVRSRRRLRAVLLAGVTGYGCALLFLLHGAPDIALTQVLVETVVLVVFVLVLRRLPEYFTDRPLRGVRWVRMALAGLVGVAVAGFLLVGAGARSVAPVSRTFAERAYEFGYGRNVVNVTLVDIRAWDTFGEISVLVVAATGVASLVFIDSRSSSIRRVFDVPYPEGVARPEPRPGRRVWLPGPRTLSPERRSIVFEVVTRLVFPSVVVFSLYLLVAGHNLPGGGFAAGMVTGLALVVRYLAGGRYELDEAAPVDAGRLIGGGLFVAALAALGPVAFGGDVLQTADYYLSLPLLGEVHLVSSVGFDLGVYLVVVGLVLDLLRTFGSRLDRQILRAERDAKADAEAQAEAGAQVEVGPQPAGERA